MEIQKGHSDESKRATPPPGALLSVTTRRWRALGDLQRINERHGGACIGQNLFVGDRNVGSPVCETDDDGTRTTNSKKSSGGRVEENFFFGNSPFLCSEIPASHSFCSLILTAMKLSAGLSPWGDIWYATKSAFLPTFYAVLRSPVMIFNPAAISRIFMSYVWGAGMGDGIDANCSATKKALITPHAHNVILDLGAGKS